jgi:hypothetical protein
LSPTHYTVSFKMKKAVLFTLLLIFYSQLQAFSQEELDGRQLLERFKQVQSQILNARIKLGEALIHYLEHAGDYVQAERMKGIYRLATDYQTFCDGEQRALFMYIYIKEGVKVYISAYLRDLLQKKKKEADASLQNLSNYSADIKDKDTLLIITSLQSRIAEAQDLMHQLVEFYASENNKYKKDTSIVD